MKPSEEIRLLPSKPQLKYAYPNTKNIEINITVIHKEEEKWKEVRKPPYTIPTNIINYPLKSITL